MITTNNYFAEVNKIGIENLPETFKKSHELVDKVTSGGSNWSTYDSNETIKRMIDLYFVKLSEYQKTLVKPEKKKEDQRIFVVKPDSSKKVENNSVVKKVKFLKPKYKVGEVFRSKPNSVFEEVEILNVYPPEHEYASVDSYFYLIKSSDFGEDTYSEESVTDYIKELKNKAIAAKLTKPKKETKNSHATLVERVDDVITLIKRYVNFHNKQKTRDQVLNLLKAVQKAILERRVNKKSMYGEEVMNIQDSLLKALKHDVKIFDITIQAKQLENYTSIVSSVAPMVSISLIKRYINLVGKLTKEKADNLQKHFMRALDKGIVTKSDKYYASFKFALNNLDAYLAGKKSSLSINEQGLTGFLSNSNVGFIPTVIAAAAGATVQALTHHHLNKNKSNLSGTEPQVMSVSDAKNETFVEIGLTGDYLKLIGRACAPTSIFIYGNGGSGKSGLSLKLADKLHQLNHSVLYAAGEQYGTPTFTELLKKVNISGGANFKIVKSLNTLPIKNFDVIVIDSKESSNLNKSSDFKQLRDAYPDKIWIITSQGLKSGEYKGDGQWLNEVETFIYCENGKASTIGEKNRWGGKGQIILY